MGGRDIKPFLSVYGHVSIDQIISVNRFPRPNTSVDALDRKIKLGGIATNISVIASSLGVPTAICVFVGQDFPQDFEDFIKSSGVITDEMVKIEGQDTSTAFIINDSSLEQMVYFLQGAQGSASKHGIDLIKNAKKSKAVHFSTGDADYYIRIMGLLRNGDRKIAFDPAQEIRDKWKGGRFQAALELSDYLFCNEFEALAVMDYMEVDSLSEIDKELVVCTKGDKGSEVYYKGERIDVPAIKPKKVVDPTGAGDAYRAGFYSAMYHGFGTEDALILAAATSSFVVENIGALSRIPTWDEVLERADREL